MASFLPPFQNDPSLCDCWWFRISSDGDFEVPEGGHLEIREDGVKKRFVDQAHLPCLNVNAFSNPVISDVLSLIPSNVNERDGARNNTRTKSPDSSLDEEKNEFQNQPS